MTKYLLAALLSGLLMLNAADETTADEQHSQKNEDKKTQDENLTVTSQHLDYDHINHTAVFTRDVKAVNGETTMTARKMTCFFDENNDPYLIIAEGDVVITRLDQKAFAQKATYKINDKLITLKYKPSILHGKNLIKGRVIIFNEATHICNIEDPDVTLFNEGQLKQKDKSAETPKPQK